jgi:hypothetical protein
MKKNNPNAGTVSKIRGYSPIKMDFIEACQDRRTSEAVKEDTRHYILAVALGIIAIIFLSINAIQQTEIKKVESLQSSPIFNAPIVTVMPPVTEQSFTAHEMPSEPIGGLFKSYMPVSAITDRTSKQWHLKQIYTIDSNGFCRLGEYYAIAMGTKYAKRIGQMFTIQLEGRTFKAIVGDFKDDKDVVDGVCKTNGSIIEFIVDKMDGDYLQEFMKGKVLNIDVVTVIKEGTE